MTNFSTNQTAIFTHNLHSTLEAVFGVLASLRQLWSLNFEKLSTATYNVAPSYKRNNSITQNSAYHLRTFL